MHLPLDWGLDDPERAQLGLGNLGSKMEAGPNTSPNVYHPIWSGTLAGAYFSCEEGRSVMASPAIRVHFKTLHTYFTFSKIH